jgi:hypothetical protein
MEHPSPTQLPLQQGEQQRTDWHFPAPEVCVAAAGTSIRQVDTIGQVRTLPVIDGEVTLTLDGAPRIFYGLSARQDDNGRHTLAADTTP